MTVRRSRPRALLAAALLAMTLVACGGSDDAGDDPTSTAPAATVVPATVVPDAGPTGTAGAIAGAMVSDGICQVTIPDDWSDDGTARGLTSTNARWTLFGNRLASDAAWQTAVDLLKAQQGGRPGATVDEGTDRIAVTQAENRSIVVRQRFPDRYCELSVAASGEVPPEVAAIWTSVAAGLAPAAE